MTDTPADTLSGAAARPTLGEALWVWLKVGLLSFGGPAGQIALMHRVVVDEKKWIDEPRYLHALNFCMLLPGPEATQLATYVGWLMHRTLGGLAAGILFILPGALVMLGLSLIYVLARGIPAVDGALFGIKAAVLVIVVEALVRIGKRALKSSLLVGIAAAAFIGIYFFAVPFPIIVIGAGLIGYVVSRSAPERLRHAADSRGGRAPPDGPRPPSRPQSGSRSGGHRSCSPGSRWASIMCWFRSACSSRSWRW